jgi:hypothetical protein
MKDNPNIGNCVCTSDLGVPIICPTTTLAPYSYPASTGAVTLMPFSNLCFMCDPILLPMPTYTSCVSAGVVHVQGLKVVSAPSHGMLKLRGVAIVAGQIISKEDMGIVTYSKVPTYIGVDTINVGIMANVGLSNVQVITINCANVDCGSCDECASCA